MSLGSRVSQSSASVAKERGSVGGCFPLLRHAFSLLNCLSALTKTHPPQAFG